MDGIPPGLQGFYASHTWSYRDGGGLLRPQDGIRTRCLREALHGRETGRDAAAGGGIAEALGAHRHERGPHVEQIARVRGLCAYVERLTAPSAGTSCAVGRRPKAFRLVPGLLLPMTS